MAQRLKYKIQSVKLVHGVLRYNDVLHISGGVHCWDHTWHCGGDTLWTECHWHRYVSLWNTDLLPTTVPAAYWQWHTHSCPRWGDRTAMFIHRAEILSAHHFFSLTFPVLRSQTAPAAPCRKLRGKVSTRVKKREMMITRHLSVFLWLSWWSQSFVS